MIYSQTFSLAVARADVRIDLGAAAWIRFYQVDSPISVKLDTPASVPLALSAPASCDTCNRAPINAIFISNAAAAGNLVVQWSDGKETLRDFLNGAAQALATSQSFLLTESMIAHSVINANNTNPQDVLGVGDGAVWGASAGGSAGQAIETTAFNYYGGLLSSVAATNVALAGGNLLFSNPRIPNTAIFANAFATTAPGFTRGLAALAACGYWQMRCDSILETPVINVAGSMYAGMGIGMDITAASGAVGVGGLRGIGMIWSNELGDNNWHLVACDGTAIRQNVNTGINAVLVHQLIELRFGILGTTPTVEAVIDNVVRATLTGWGATFAVITGFAPATMALRLSAGKLQAAQATNNVRWHMGGYSGFQFGRLS